MASKLEKTIARQKEKVAEGQYYEAHQHLRVIANRYLSSTPPNYKAAIDLLSEGALLLLQAGQSGPSPSADAFPSADGGRGEGTGGSAGSGGDLCMYLMQVYEKSETKEDGESKARVLRLLRAFPRTEPTRKRFMQEIMSWSSKHGEYPSGDPDLHHAIGSLLSTTISSDTDIYDAERHLILGTRDSPSVLTNIQYTWYTQDSPDTAPLYCARAVLPYLLVGNIRGATQAHLLFTSKLNSAGGLGGEHVDSENSKLDARIYPSLPLLNFLTLLLLAIQRGTGGKDIFLRLRSKYRPYLEEQAGGSWDEALDGIAESWFGVRKPKPMGNPMMDMLGSMLGGGMGGGGGGGSRGGGGRSGRSPGPPPSLGMD